MGLSNPSFLNANRETNNLDTVNLLWDYADNNGYVIYRSEDGGPYLLLHTILPDVGFGEGGFGQGPFGVGYTEITSWDDTNVIQSNSYTYYIASLDHGTPLSNPTYSQEVPKVQAKWAESANFKFNSGLDVYWDEVPVADRYLIYRTTNGGTRAFHVSFSDGRTNCNITNLSHLDNHVFDVVCKMSDDSISNKTECPELIKRAPQVVENLTITKNNKTFDLNWTNIDEGDEIEIYMSTNGGELVLIDTIPSNSTSYNVSAGLSLNNFYYFAVKQKNSSGGGLTISSIDSITDGISATWEHGAGSDGNETFELSKKQPENSCIFPEFKPVIISKSDPCGILSPKKSWNVIYNDVSTNFDETNPDRGKFQMYSVRAKDSSNNFSERVILEKQI